MRALWAREGRFYSSEVELHDVAGVLRIGGTFLVGTVKTLGLEIPRDHLNSLGIGSNLVEIVDGLVIDREETHGGTVLR